MMNYLQVMQGLLLFVYCVNVIPVSAQQDTDLVLSMVQAKSFNTVQDASEKLLSEVLADMEIRYDISISYDPVLITGKRANYTIDLDHSVEENLNDLLDRQGLRFKKLDKGYYLILAKKKKKSPPKKLGLRNEPSPNTALPKWTGDQLQTLRVKRDKIVTGKVTDEFNNPLPGVNVFVKGTTIGTVSDVEGNYRLSVPDDSDVLLFSFIGYTTETITIGSQVVIDIQLVPDISTLQEIVVVGYGTQQKRDLTGSVVSVKGEDLVNIPVPRIEEQLKAKVPGLQITTTGSHPGGTIQIRLRGNNSIQGDNSPLIVIDGMIGGDLFFLNPNDIESVEVLKDASATAIYGARGANGVIIVTTKKGSGDVKVNFDAFYGWQQVNKTIDVLNADQFREVFNQTHPSDPLEESAVDVDWQDEIYEVAAIQNYQLSFSGGSEETSYLFSTSYFDQQGIVPGSDLNRVTVRLNLDQKIGDRVKIGNNLSFGRTINNLVRMNEGFGSFGSPLSTLLLQAPPVIPIIDPDTEDFSRNELNPNRENPARLVEQRNDIRTNNYLIGNFYGNIELVKGLSYRLNLGYIVRDFLQQRYDGVDMVGSQGGRARVETTKRTELLLENTLTYQGTFAEKHDLTVLAGFTTQESNRDDTSIEGTGFSSDELKFDAIQTATTIGPVSTGSSQERIASFLGRINYRFADKYLLTASFRADGASVFAENNKWGYFPSASVGWIVSDEPFLSDQRMISNLKLRASYGSTGSPNISPFQSLASFNSGQEYTLGEEVVFNGTLPNRVANADLKWETTSTLNFGIDLGFLDQRIEIAAEYYEKETEDLHFNKPLPDYTGFSTQTQNVGRTTNKGFELAVNSVNLDGVVKWNSNFNVFFNRNEVVEIGDDFQDELFVAGGAGTAQLADATVLREGEPLGSFFGYIFDGIYQNQEEVDRWQQPGAVPGSVKFFDRNGDGVVNVEDRGIIGNPQPDFVWGFTNNLSFKNFDLNFTFQGVQGADVFWATKYFLLRSNEEDNMLTDVLNAWTGEGTSNTQQALDQDPGEMSTRYIEDGSYIRLQNVALGYNLPGSILEKLKMTRLRFYISAQNLFLITDYPGYDPEVNSRGGNGRISRQNQVLGYDEGAFPGVHTFTLGLNAIF